MSTSPKKEGQKSLISSPRKLSGLQGKIIAHKPSFQSSFHNSFAGTILDNPGEDDDDQTVFSSVSPTIADEIGIQKENRQSSFTSSFLPENINIIATSTDSEGKSSARNPSEIEKDNVTDKNLEQLLDNHQKSPLTSKKSSLSAQKTSKDISHIDSDKSAKTISAKNSRQSLLNSRKNSTPTIERDNRKPDQSQMNTNFGISCMGYHLKNPLAEDVTQIHIKRKDPITKKIKTVPKMVHNLEANRPKVPEHQLVEDDWRAYRSVLHNQARAKNAILSRDQQRETFLRDNLVAANCLKMQVDNVILMKKSDDYVKASAPKLDVYKPAMRAPTGYMVQRFADQRSLQEQRDKSRVPRYQSKYACVLPVVEPHRGAEGSYHVARDNTWSSKASLVYDPGAIMTSRQDERARVFNEPDSVACDAMFDDVSLSLVQRAQTQQRVADNLGKCDCMNESFLMQEPKKRRTTAEDIKEAPRQQSVEEEEFVEICEKLQDSRKARNASILTITSSSGFISKTSQK